MDNFFWWVLEYVLVLCNITKNSGKEYKTIKNMKNLKTLQSSKKLLKDEWMYCMRMIQERIDEIEEINLENYKETLYQQHLMMGAVRNLVGKGYYYMTDERFKKISRNEKIENAISDMHKAIDEIEYR